ncbi:MAG TPA: hypothetical protein VHY08_23145 [Bacillota bacterium]|nr:hypothetical protein [Bacillota bacterium]
MTPFETGMARDLLSDFELNSPQLQLIPAKPDRIQPFDRDCFILETVSGNLALWIHHRSEAALAYQMQILKICEINGAQGFLYPISLTDGRTYARLDENRWFYVTEWPELRGVSFRSTGDLRLLVKLITGFRKAQGQGLVFGLPERNEETELISRFNRIIRCFDSFALLARRRLHPTQFDRLFLAYLPEARTWIGRALALLEKCDYSRFWASLTTQDLIINRLVRSNLRIHTSGSGAFCLRLNDFRWDLPIIDLGILLIKTGRSAQWNRKWFYDILSEYQKPFPLTHSEAGLLQAYLTFPWSFYRLAARYYYNRTQWPLFTFIEKMDRVLVEDKWRGELVLSELFREDHF